MQAEGIKNRSSLYSIKDSLFKTRGSFSMGRGGHFQKRRRGSVCAGISILRRYIYPIYHISESTFYNILDAEFEVEERFKEDPTLFEFPEDKKND